MGGAGFGGVQLAAPLQPLDEGVDQAGAEPAPAAGAAGDAAAVVGNRDPRLAALAPSGHPDAAAATRKGMLAGIGDELVDDDADAGGGLVRDEHRLELGLDRHALRQQPVAHPVAYLLELVLQPHGREALAAQSQAVVDRADRLQSLDRL